MAKRYKNLVDRLLSNCAHVACEILGTPCWEWTLSVCNKGYPQANFWDKVLKKRIWKRAHILLWELVTGRKVRDGYTLDHRCLNTRCIRPDHLEEVLRAVNTARGNRTRHGKAAIHAS